jgi:hypothetical protein
MKNLKKLVVAFSLIFVLAITAFGGETQSPPCSPPNPGETQSPPCSLAQLAPDDPTIPGETETSRAAETVVITTIADAAVGALLSFF